jgi:hypothetical protein
MRGRDRGREGQAGKNGLQLNGSGAALRCREAHHEHGALVVDNARMVNIQRLGSGRQLAPVCQVASLAHGDEDVLQGWCREPQAVTGQRQHAHAAATPPSMQHTRAAFRL